MTGEFVLAKIVSSTKLTIPLMSCALIGFVTGAKFIGEPQAVAQAQTPKISRAPSVEPLACLRASIPHCQTVAPARISCAESHSGLFFNHDALSIAEVVWPGKFVAQGEQSLLRVT